MPGDNFSAINSANLSLGDKLWWIGPTVRIQVIYLGKAGVSSSRVKVEEIDYFAGDYDRPEIGQEFMIKNNFLYPLR